MTIGMQIPSEALRGYRRRGEKMRIYLSEFHVDSKFYGINTETNMINRIFSFYEEMAVYGDEKVKTLLQVGLLECLWDEKIVYDNALQHIGTETLSLFNNLRTYLRIPIR